MFAAALACGPTDSEDGPATTNAGSAGDTAGEGTDEGADSSTAGLDPCAGPQPAPGCAGGLCLGPDGTCNEQICNEEQNYCYDPDDPCAGFECGGSERGTCSPVEGLPACVCNEGFENESFALVCCPLEGGDNLCP